MCHTEMGSGWKNEFAARTPLSPGHAAHQPHMLFSNLQPDRLLEIIQTEKPTSLSFVFRMFIWFNML